MCFFNIQTHEIKKKHRFSWHDGVGKVINWKTIIKKTKIFFEFISFTVEKTQICLILKLIKVIWNLKEIQEIQD